VGTNGALLEIRGLSVSAPTGGGGRVHILQDVSLEVEAGGTLGIVGESGSGKTMTSLAVMGLLPSAVRVESGEILLDGEDLRSKSRREMQRIRGARMAMILQDPMTALDPCFTIESQLVQPLRMHRGLGGTELDAAVKTSLEQVRLSATRERRHQYPHQLSGGMRQRVTSAIALAGGPRLLIADEPTTALDPTTQAQYLQLLKELQETTGVALMLIAHDLIVVRHMCERVAVMYAGEVVEEGTVDQIFARPQHPYTRALMGAVPVMQETVDLEPIPGQVPLRLDELPPCHFAPRCEFTRDICRSRRPELTPRGEGQGARCWGTGADGWIET
jgi:oligopeptide/dipeptide ABC transporter ATP-binding protein